MIKIDLSKPIKSIKGEQIETPERDGKGQPVLDKGKPKMKKMTVRDYLLTILSTKFPLEETKEAFWTTELGQLIASGTKIVGGKVDEKGKIKGGKEVPNIEIEISDDKAKFLRRIIENNKVTQQLPMGQTKDIELFFPFELGQLLKLFSDLRE